jgi:L-lactate dehydrogenase complex protein LldG
MVKQDLVERFIASAVSAGAEVFRAPDVRSALTTVARRFEDERIQTALASTPLQAEAEAAGLVVRLPDRTEDIAAAQAAIVLADFGAAETGTLVRLDSGVEERLAWTLPPLCVCLLERQKIVSDLESLAGVFGDHLSRAGHPGRQVSLVTGPSRTADIECQLTVGVQGPARLVIGLIDGEFF